MTIKCSSCGIPMQRIDNHGKKYYLFAVDTSVEPASIELEDGIAIDAFVCTTCGSIKLQSDDYIGVTPRYED